MAPSSRPSVELRASRHAALGDPVRLAIIDELAVSDRAPVELRRIVNVESNLLAHHLDVLEAVGLIERMRSHGDGRRRYVHLRREAFEGLSAGRPITASKALFICTRNSARSQLAAALWREMTGADADSAGTDPAPDITAGTIAAAARAGLDLRAATPKDLSSVGPLPTLVVTVCDSAHEGLAPNRRWLHWSISDPVESGTRRAYDVAVEEIRTWIAAITEGTASTP